MIEEKNITVYICDKEEAPVVYSNDFSDSADAVLAECRRMGCLPFHLVSITGIRWDEELSPWAHSPIVAKNDHFTGEADGYLQLLENKIVPYVRTIVPNGKCNMLHGYSMGGLFALYAAHHSQLFDAYVAPSASVWYPDFVSYVREHDFINIPKCIYLSIGSLESRTKNVYLSKTESNMEELYHLYKERQVTAIFERNPGNHYKDVPMRIAKGLNWTLRELEGKKGI